MTHKNYEENLLESLLQKNITKDFSLLVFKNKMFKLYCDLLERQARVRNLSITLKDTDNLKI